MLRDAEITFPQRSSVCHCREEHVKKLFLYGSVVEIQMFLGIDDRKRETYLIG
jgi:hypothetical protein